MAAGLLASRMPSDAGYIIESAGIRGLDGQPAEPFSVEAMREHDIDISSHRARTVTPDLLKAFDLIITMESSQQKWIQKKMPSVGGYVHLLDDRCGRNIPDPMGGTRADFLRSLREIEEYLGDWLPYILRHNEHA